VFSARHEYARGNGASAVDELINAWRFARHLGTDGSSVSWGLQFSLQRTEVEPLLAHWLPTLGAQAAKRLQSQLSSLPKVASLSEVLCKEREMYVRWLGRTAARDGIDCARKEILALARGRTDLPDAEALKGLISNTNSLSRSLEEASHRFDEAILLASLSYPKSAAVAAKFNKTVSQDHPITRLLLLRREPERPTFMLGFLEARNDVELSMLRAAIVLRLNGLDAFQHVKDPFANGPFGAQLTAGGFVLTSQLEIDGRPLSMQFGRSAMGQLRAPELPLRKPEAEEPIFDPTSDAESKVREALVQATAKHLRVLVDFGFNGCGPCRRLHRVLNKTKGLTDGYVEVLADSTNKRNRALAHRYHTEIDKGVPLLTILDAKGNVLANIVPGEEFTGEDGFNVARIRACLKKWAVPTEGPNTRQ
jgi:hypothetical protein